jgi:Spy/CpxP family protein refolding chaperone
MIAKTILAAALVGALAFTATVSRAADPLPSWNEGKVKQQGHCAIMGNLI